MVWLLRTVKVVGGILSFAALALGVSQFYQVSGDTLGPGAFLLAIPKILAGSFAPFAAVAGLLGGGLGLAASYFEKGKRSATAGVRSAPGRARLLAGTPLIVLAGLTGALLAGSYTQKVAATGADFAAAFGAGWQAQLPANLRGGLLAQRWTWRLGPAPGVRVQRDLAYATVPGTERKLLADLWTPPSGVAPSGLGFVYVHGGGYVSQDKGGPTETWFAHLAAQGHVVLDVSYRLIPETDVPGMQGDVKRAVAWLKANGGQYGVDPDRIILGGGSAGSQLALLAAYAPHHPLFTPADLRGQDLSVRGVIGYYNAGDNRLESRSTVAPSTFETALANSLTSLIESWSSSAIPAGDAWHAAFTGRNPDEWAELYRQLSPIVHAGSDVPPTMQVVGEHDVYVGRSPAIAQLHQALHAAGVPSVTLVLPRTDHAFDMFFPEFSPAAQTAMYEVDRFLALMAGPVAWGGTSTGGQTERQ